MFSLWCSETCLKSELAKSNWRKLSTGSQQHGHTIRWNSVCCIYTYFHVFRVPWRIVTDSGLDDWISWSLLCTHSLNYNQYSAIAELHNFRFTATHALGFSVFTSRILATDLNTGTVTSNHYEIFLPFFIQSPWTADSPELGPILRFNLSSLI
jgi:hypothetical protein